jgi:hypothetical protein
MTMASTVFGSGAASNSAFLFFFCSNYDPTTIVPQRCSAQRSVGKKERIINGDRKKKINNKSFEQKNNRHPPPPFETSGPEGEKHAPSQATAAPEGQNQPPNHQQLQRPETQCGLVTKQQSLRKNDKSLCGRIFWPCVCSGRSHIPTNNNKKLVNWLASLLRAPLLINQEKQNGRHNNLPVSRRK